MQDTPNIGNLVGVFGVLELVISRTAFSTASTGVVITNGDATIRPTAATWFCLSILHGLFSVRLIDG